MLERLAVGEVPSRHHTALRSEQGALRYEACLRRDGVDGPYTLMYHQRRPHAQRAAEVHGGWTLPKSVGQRRLLTRHFRTQELEPSAGAPVTARVPLMFNEDVVVSVLKPSAGDDVYFVNADGDDLLFIHEGGGLLRSQLGDLRFEKGDFVYVPRGVLHRFVPNESPQYWLSIECFEQFDLPDRWRNTAGQLRLDAPYAHRDFRRPTLPPPLDEGLRSLLVKRNGGFHGFEYVDPPLDVVGFDGAIYPWALPVDHLRPGPHQPDGYETFSARGIAVRTYLPRPVLGGAESIACPLPSAFRDGDDLEFHDRGEFVDQVGLGPGSLSFHPAGLAHGPHPGAYEASVGRPRTASQSVALTSAKPLLATAAAVGIEDPAYQDSFRAHLHSR